MKLRYILLHLILQLWYYILEPRKKQFPSYFLSSNGLILTRIGWCDVVDLPTYCINEAIPGKTIYYELKACLTPAGQGALLLFRFQKVQFNRFQDRDRIVRDKS